MEEGIGIRPRGVEEMEVAGIESGGCSKEDTPTAEGVEIGERDGCSEEERDRILEKLREVAQKCGKEGTT